MMTWRSSHFGFHTTRKRLHSLPRPPWSKKAQVPERVEFDGYAFDTSSGHFASGHRKHPI